MFGSGEAGLAPVAVEDHDRAVDERHPLLVDASRAGHVLGHDVEVPVDALQPFAYLVLEALELIGRTCGEDLHVLHWFFTSCDEKWVSRCA